MESVKPVRHSLLLLTLFSAACAEEEPASTILAQNTTLSARGGMVFVGPVSMENADGDTLCTGTFSISLSSGSLSGGGDCGDLDLTVTGWLDSDGIVTTGSVQIDGTGTPPPSDGSLSGLRSGGTLELVWSLEIPLPDDPPIDDDYLSLSTSELAYGQALLRRQRD